MKETLVKVGNDYAKASLTDIRDKGYPDGVSVHLAVYNDLVGPEVDIFMSPDKAEALGRAILAAADEARRILTSAG
jgi:hypothetical protein